jgi:ATP adenylyltransferase
MNTWLVWLVVRSSDPRLALKARRRFVHSDAGAASARDTFCDGLPLHRQGGESCQASVMGYMAGCLGCEIAAGGCDVPGGIVHQTGCWIVNHAVGRLNLGTLVVAPREHVVAVADLDDVAVVELGPLLRDAARIVEAICRPEQTYVCVWSHGQTERRHLHILVQPVTAALVAQYGGLRSEQLQVKVMTTGEPPDPGDVERFCADARQRFALGS